MHEFELGVWKKVFIHLLRILECVHGATDKLNKRYSSISKFRIVSHLLECLRFREVPTFGRDSIRRFTNCVSELKQLGARDYENILQVSHTDIFVEFSERSISSVLSQFLRDYYLSLTTPI